VHNTGTQCEGRVCVRIVSADTNQLRLNLQVSYICKRYEMLSGRCFGSYLL